MKNDKTEKSLWCDIPGSRLGQSTGMCLESISERALWSVILPVEHRDRLWQLFLRVVRES